MISPSSADFPFFGLHSTALLLPPPPSQVEFRQRYGHLSVSTDKGSMFYVRALGGWVNAQVAWEGGREGGRGQGGGGGEGGKDVTDDKEVASRGARASAASCPGT